MRRRKIFLSSRRGFAVVFLVALGAPLALAQQVSGHVTADGTQPISGAIVKLQAKGGVQTAVATTGEDGSFSVSGLKTDTALLSVEKDGRLLYRSIVSTKTKGALNISLMKPFHLPDWHPVDIAPDPVAGVLVLEIGGGVSRIRSDQSGHHQESLFSVPLSYMVVSIAADIGAIYVTSNSQLGCTVFKFTIATRSVSRKIISTTNSCHGIATGGGSIYVVLTESKQIAYSDNWNSPFSRTFDLRPSSSPEPLVFDNAGQRLLVGDTTGKIYAVSVPSGKITLVNSEVGWAASIAATMNHILVASKTKIISIARADNRIENPPPLRSLTGGIIAGVVSDASGNIWYADYDNGSVVGPLVVK